MGRAVSVKLFGALERVAGQRHATVEVAAGATVLDLLEALAGRYGPDFAAAIFGAPRRIHTHLRIFVNEEEAGVSDRIPDGAATPEVALLVLQAFEGGSR